MRWRIDGRTVQEVTPFRVEVKADRMRAEKLLEERTEVFRLKRRRDQLSVLIAEREDVETRLRKLEAAASPAERPLLLGDFVREWLDSPRRRDFAPDALQRNRRRLEAFVEWAGSGVDLRAVDDAMAERYAREISAGASGSIYNKTIGTLAAAWKAVAGPRRIYNPWEGLPKKRLDTHVRRVLAPREIEAIIAAAEGEYKALMMIGAKTGLRLGDCCRLRWEDFGADGVLSVRTRKTGAEVAIPAARLLRELRGMFGEGAEGFVVPGLAERYERDAAGVCANVRRIFRRAGIEPQARREGWARARPEASFHSLRHTFVTRAIEAGVPPAIVRALVGHSTATMTEHYTHVSPEAILAAFAKIS